MPRRSRLVWAGAAAVALVLPSLPAVPAQAAPATVVLSLRPAATLDVARAPQDAGERRDRTDRTTPTAASRAVVHDWLTDHGFTVGASTDWTMTARGPAQLLERRIPAALRRTVLAAVRESSAPMRPRAVPVGWSPTQLRDAYAVPGSGAGTTVATIQFSGWRSADAEVFARGADIALAPRQITTETVLGARADVSDDAGGDFEVALDVEAVLGAAPAARQRVFVAPNTTGGAVAVYDAVATAAERDGLTAVSISWGACELETAPALLSSLEQSLARMVAAGATVTAATGDVGAYGCASDGSADGRLSVDYPASSPSVLAIGGTSLRRTAGGWAERAWSDTEGAVDGYAGGGSGGGLSARFPLPVWQQGRLTGDRRGLPDLAVVGDPATGIGIYGPDDRGRRSWQTGGGTSAAAPLVAGQLASTLSALGRTAGLGRISVPLYGATGAFRDVVEGDNHHYRAGRGYDLATGLGSPQWAALGPQLLEPALLAAPATGALAVPVAAYAPGSRSARYAVAETAEEACATAGSPVLPRSLHLPDGPDRTTAVVLAVVDDGACRTTSRPLVLDRTAPGAGATLRPSSRAGVLQLAWTASDPSPSSGAGRVSWSVRNTATGAVVASGTAERGGSLLRALPRGAEYVLEVVARDAVGNVSSTAVSEALRND